LLLVLQHSPITTTITITIRRYQLLKNDSDNNDYVDDSDDDNMTVLGVVSYKKKQYRDIVGLGCMVLCSGYMANGKDMPHGDHTRRACTID